eukprot:GHVU01209778.1.p1 GENE.GHVU01209778.1~~GHVU01209778.1.p1  ORF type:complete len:121 (-),score=1.48 GHVU01209778.1:98-460(-)
MEGKTLDQGVSECATVSSECARVVRARALGVSVSTRPCAHDGLPYSRTCQRVGVCCCSEAYFTTVRISAVALIKMVSLSMRLWATPGCLGDPIHSRSPVVGRRQSSLPPVQRRYPSSAGK